MSMLDKARKSRAKKKAKPAKAKVKKTKSKQAARGDVLKPAGDIIRDSLTADNVKAEKKDRGEPRHYIMWVGSDHYPTIEHYLREARTMGVSKRLNMTTPHLIPGETRIYLAHNRWYETSARFLDVNTQVDRIDVPKISKMKALRRIGQAMADTELTASQTVDQLDAGKGPAWDILNHTVESNSDTVLVNKEAIFRLISGNKMDWTFTALVKKKRKHVPSGGSIYFNYRRTTQSLGTRSVAAAMLICRDYVQAVDAGKAVFGYFLLECLEFILPKGKKLPEHLEGTKREKLLDLISKADGGRRDDKLKKIVRIVKEEDEKALVVQPRGCGYRKPDGVYAVASTPAEAMADKGKTRAKGLGVSGPLYTATNPVEARGFDYYRGLRSVPDDFANVLSLEMELGGTKKSN